MVTGEERETARLPPLAAWLRSGAEPVPPEDLVNLIDEAQCESAIGRVARSLLELQEVADGEGVGPQVACRRLFSNQTRALSEVPHQVP